MAQISLVKTLVLSYMELQRQIDTHHIDAPAYVLRDLRDQQAAILASLEAKPPTELDSEDEHTTVGELDYVGYGPNLMAKIKREEDAKKQLGELIESQKEPVDE